MAFVRWPWRPGTGLSPARLVETEPQAQVVTGPLPRRQARRDDAVRGPPGSPGPPRMLPEAQPPARRQRLTRNYHPLGRRAPGQASGKLTAPSVQPSPRVREPGPPRTCPRFQEQNPTQGLQKETFWSKGPPSPGNPLGSPKSTQACSESITYRRA